MYIQKNIIYMNVILIVYYFGSTYEYVQCAKIEKIVQHQRIESKF